MTKKYYTKEIESLPSGSHEGVFRHTVSGGKLETSIWQNGAWQFLASDGAARAGWIDYNDTTGNVSMTADTWTIIPNNGLGSFTNKLYPPADTVELMNIATGAIDPTSLDLGDFILIRNDFTVTPTINNSALDFRYTLGAGEGAYTLQQSLGRLDRGSGIGYRFALRVDSIYMGDTNTRDNPIGLQVRCSSDAILNNAGSVIEVIKR